MPRRQGTLSSTRQVPARSHLSHPCMLIFVTKIRRELYFIFLILSLEFLTSFIINFFYSFVNFRYHSDYTRYQHQSDFSPESLTLSYCFFMSDLSPYSRPDRVREIQTGAEARFVHIRWMADWIQAFAICFDFPPS